MIGSVIKYWQPIAASAATAAVALGLHMIASGLAEIRHDKELKSQAVAFLQQCKDEKAITERVAHDFQNKISGLNARLADARRLYDNACVNVIADTSGSSDGKAASREPSGSNVAGIKIRAGNLIDLAGEGEKYRLQLISCQTFISDTWASKKQ